MEQVKQNFRERCREIERYLKTLRFIEERGSEIISRNQKFKYKIDLTTQHVLKASVFLHLYNLIESTITSCLARVAERINELSLTYLDLTKEWQSAWLREQGKTNAALNPEKRLNLMLDVCEDVAKKVSIDFRPSLASGNLDDDRIEKIAKRHGVEIKLSSTIMKPVKVAVVNDDGPLRVIRKRRNLLAHGFSSFSDCGKSVSVNDLRRWRITVIRYLCGVIRCFDNYLKSHSFRKTA